VHLRLLALPAWMQVRGVSTTAWMQEVEQCLEQLSRMRKLSFAFSSAFDFIYSNKKGQDLEALPFFHIPSGM